MNQGFSLRDVNIIPRIPVVPAHEVLLNTRLAKKVALRLPFVASPMDSVTNTKVAVTLSQLGGLAVLHNNYTRAEAQACDAASVKAEISTFKNEACSPCVAALAGLEGRWPEHVETLLGHGVDLIALDTLHSAPHLHLKVAEEIKTRWPQTIVMSGNVVHGADCSRLISAGVDCVRVGCSAASINNGRGLLGIARAQASAIQDCVAACSPHDIPVIADGGLRTPGDIAVALALGASAVMLGRLFAMCLDSPAPIAVDAAGRERKVYRGMSRQGLVSSNLICEGASTHLEIDVPVSEKVQLLAKHLRVSISAAGCRSLEEFRRGAEIELVTPGAREEAGLCERI